MAIKRVRSQARVAPHWSVTERSPASSCRSLEDQTGPGSLAVASSARPRQRATNTSPSTVISEFRKSPNVRNGILGNLAVTEFACICPHLQAVSLKERAVLQDAGKPIEYVHFIEAGLVSLRTLTAGGVLETAMVGPHGAVGASVALGAETAIHYAVVLVAGSALKIRVDHLRQLMIERPLIREHLLQHIQQLMVHISQAAFCGVRHELEQRLAGWLSLACDTLDRDILPITHDHLSLILGLPRAGLTKSLIRFAEHGLIRKTRGFIQVRERALLREKACACYGTIANVGKNPAPAGLVLASTSLQNRIYS